MKYKEISTERMKVWKIWSVIIVAFTLFMTNSFNGFGQSFFSGCNTTVQVGTTCIYTALALPGTTYYSGYVNQGTQISNDPASGRKRFSRTWSTIGGPYATCLIYQGGCIYQEDIYVVGVVGPVSITSNSPASMCQSQATSTYTATATNAKYYDWVWNTANGSLSLSPDRRTGTITWSTSFVGSTSVTVKAYNDAGAIQQNSFSIVRTANLNFQGYLTVPSGIICEGATAQLTASANEAATYNWILHDNGASAGTGSTLNTSGLVDVAYVEVRITPAAGLQCLLNPGMQRLYAYPSTYTGSALKYTVKKYVYGLSVNSPLPGNARCMGGGTTQFTATAISETSRAWSFTPASAGSIDQSGLVTWNPTYVSPSGTFVNVTATVYGCGGSSQTVTVPITIKGLPTNYNLTGPAQLCDMATGILQLTGSAESGVTYDLYKELNVAYPVVGVEWKKIAGGSATSWSLPVAAIVGPGEGPFNYESNGKYFVKATSSNGCPAVDTAPFTINKIAKGAVTITTSPAQPIPGIIIGCDGAYVTLTANGGTNYEWHENRGGLPGCPPLNPNKTEEACRPKLEDYGQPNQINIQISVSSQNQKLYLVAKDAICQEWTTSGIVKIQLTPALELKKITPAMDYRCQGAGLTQFSVVYTGDTQLYQWTLSNGAGNVTNQGINASIDWNAGFTGKTILKFTGIGCNGTISLSREITVHPTLEADENRIRAFTAQEAMDTPALLSASMTDKTKVNVVTNYLDGLGRPVQNVNHYASPAGSDIIELKRYDQYGRESARYLPFVASTNFSYNSLAVQNQLNYYTLGASKTAQDAMPIAITQYEASPLNKVLKQGSPGLAWQPVSTDPYDQNDRTVKKAYDFNATNEIIFFTYNRATNQLTAKENNAIKYYAINTLSVNSTIDENQNEVRDYTDKQGRTICKKAQVSGSGASKVYASTYYVYDDLGNLAIVLPPEAVTRFTQP